MTPFCRPLWEEQNTGHNKEEKNSRCRVAAQRQPTSIQGLVKEIADHRAQRSRENEGGPKEQGARDGCPVVRCRNEYQQSAKYYCASPIAQPRRICCPIAKG